MKLIILAVGTRMPAWVEEAYADFAKRMPRECPLELREIKAEPRTTGTTVEAMVAAEAARIRAALPSRCRKIILDERGTEATTRLWAQKLGEWMGGGEDVADEGVVEVALALVRDAGRVVGVHEHRRDGDHRAELRAEDLPRGRPGQDRDVHTNVGAVAGVAAAPAEGVDGVDALGQRPVGETDLLTRLGDGRGLRDRSGHADSEGDRSRGEPVLHHFLSFPRIFRLPSRSPGISLPVCR